MADDNEQSGRVDILSMLKWLKNHEYLPQGSGLRAVFRMGDTVDYYDGEQPPAKE